MNRSEFTFLQAEKDSLVGLIERAPQNAVISRMSLQARLDEVESLLGQHSACEMPVEGQITFRGKPVLGTQGIEATFASKTLEQFSEMVAAKASSYHGPLSHTGKIPNRDAYQLSIVGTTVGSFGFVFQEKPSEQRTIKGMRSPLESALLDCIEFFNVLKNGDDEELTNVIDNTDERVLFYIRRFLDELATNDALCAVESGSHSFRFDDTSEVRYSSRKIASDNIRVWSETHVGEFIGILVSEKKFDFRVSKDSSLLKGKISDDIEDLEEINRNHLFRPLEIIVQGKQVGSGTPRYTLETFDRSFESSAEEE